MRVVLAIVSGVLCALLGMRQAQRLREEHHRLHRWELILQQLCLLLQERSLSLPEAFRHCAQENSPADDVLLRLADALQRQPLIALEDLYQPQEQEGPILARLMARLSHGSMDSRKQAAQHAAQEIALLAQSAREKASQDARMWITLGWTCGACLALMLL